MKYFSSTQFSNLFHDDFSKLSEMIDNGYSLKKLSDIPDTPPIFFIFKPNIEHIRILLEKGLEINATNAEGNSVAGIIFPTLTLFSGILHLPSAIIEGDFDKVREIENEVNAYADYIEFLSKYGVDFNNVHNCSEDYDQTLLTFAAEYSFHYFAEKLLKVGVDPNEKNNLGYTAMDYAEYNNDAHMVEILNKFINNNADDNNNLLESDKNLWEIDWDSWHANYMASGKISFPVAGVKFKNEDGTKRQDLINKMDKYEAVKILSEPSNQFNPNALAIYSSRGKIGYVPNEYIDDVNGFLKTQIIIKATRKQNDDNDAYLMIDIISIENKKITIISRLLELNLEVLSMAPSLSEKDELFADLDFENERIKICYDEDSSSDPMGYISKEESRVIFDFCKNIALKNNNIFDVYVYAEISEIQKSKSGVDIFVLIKVEEDIQE